MKNRGERNRGNVPTERGGNPPGGGDQSSMIVYTCATKHFQNNPITSLALYQKKTLNKF